MEPGYILKLKSSGFIARDLDRWEVDTQNRPTTVLFFNTKERAELHRAYLQDKMPGDWEIFRVDFVLDGPL